MYIKKVALVHGTAQSGHSFVGSILDAHPRMCIGHELGLLPLFSSGAWTSPDEVFQWIFEKTQIINRMGRKTFNRFGEPHDQSVIGQIKDSSSGVSVIGNKNGLDDTIVCGYPNGFVNAVERLGEFISPVEQVFIFVIRHPLDSSTWPTGYHVIQDHYNMISTSQKYTVYYEDLITNLEVELGKLVEFLDLEMDESYLRNVRSRTLAIPPRSREKLHGERKVDRDALRTICRNLPLYRRYSDDLGESRKGAL